MTDGPTQAGKRFVAVDALRGFALAGVALAHMAEQYIAGPPRTGLMDAINGPLDFAAMGLIQFLVVGKFFALFSILFGLGFAIQINASAQRGTAFSGRYLWRVTILMAIGYVHHLFYRGDILTIYALLAPLLLLFQRASNTALLTCAVLLCSGLPRFIALAIWGSGPLFGLPQQPMQSPQEEAYFDAIYSGSMLSVMQANALYGLKIKLNYQILDTARLYYTFAYFLIGLWLGRLGLFTKAGDYLSQLRKIAGWSVLAWFIAVALAIGVFATAPQPVDFTSWQAAFAMNFLDWANLAMTLAIGCTLLLLWHKDRWARRLALLAPYGRMALTNYVLQTLIGTYLLFGWGLGLMGQISTGRLAVVALSLTALQALASRYWLRYCHYGPLEWLWRSATYWRVQPLRRQTAGLQCP